MRFTLLLLVLLVTACSPDPTPHKAVQLTPSSFTHGAFSPRGELAISTSEQVAIFDSQGDLLQIINVDQPAGSWQLSWASQDELYLADKKQVLRWHTQEKQLSGGWTFGAEPLRTITASQHQLAISQGHGIIHLLTLTRDGQVRQHQEWQGHTEQIQHLLFSQDNQFLITADNRAQVKSWGLQSLDLQWTYEGEPQQNVTGIAEQKAGDWLSLVLSKKSRLPTGQREHQIIHLNIKNGKIEEQWPFQSLSIVSSMLWSPFGLIVGGGMNQWWLLGPEGSELNRKWPQARQFGRDSGVIQGLYAETDSLSAASTSGYLQIWTKQDIVNAINHEN